MMVGGGRFVLGAWMCSALLRTGSPELADDGIALSWDAPPQCPAKADVMARIRARAVDRATVQIEAEAVVERSAHDPASWHLRLWMRGDEVVAEREIEAQSCDALADAVATILAVAATSPPVAPTLVEIPAPVEVAREPALQSSRSSSPSIEASASVTRPKATAPDVAPRRSLRPRARLGVLGGVDHGALPGTGGTLVGEVGLQWPHLRVSAFGVYGFGRRVSASDVAARHRVAAGGVSVCGVAPLSAFELGGCASAELGALSSEGTRGRALRTKRSWWAAGSLGAFAAWRFASRWSLVVRVDALVPAFRRNFLIGDELVGRLGPIGVRALGGLAVVLP